MAEQAAQPRQSVGDLLSGYALILAELRARGVVRTNNAPAGDYAEWLVAKALGGALAPNSAKSYDLRLAAGDRVQVKARVVSDPPQRGQLQTSPFRSWEFDLAAFVLFGERDYVVRQASLVPVSTVRGFGRHQTHVNGDIVFMTPELIGSEHAVDITSALRATAAEC